MDEAVALEFAADVEQAVASVRELADNAQVLADTAKEASDGVASIAEPASAAASSTQELATTSKEAADALKAAGASADEAAKQATVYTDAMGRARDANGRFVASAKAAGDAAQSAGVKQDAASKASGRWKLAIVGIAVALALAVAGAATFQQSTTKLVTSAGESVQNLTSDQQGLMSMSAQTATSLEQLSSGLYQVNSAGFHGAEGLDVLRASAEGAKAEGADLGEVANAVTSGLNAYGLSASHATAFTNMMVATVAAGKMTMQDLASSLSNVLPIAASAHISFAQVGGALATMTSMGVSARQGTQDLAFAIRSLLSPSSVAINEMNQFGISSTDVSEKLGQRGLTGTIGYLAQQIATKMGPSGLVILNTFNQSRTAAADANQMLQALPPSIRGVAQAYLDGSISSKQWTKELQGMPPITAHLASEFATMANKAHGFNSLLTSGSPAAQTFASALSKVMGGATGLNVALMLTGGHTATFAANVKSVGGAASGAGKDVAGWNLITKETSFQLAQAKYSIEAAGTALGMALLPPLNAVLHPLDAFLVAIAGNKAASIALAVVLGGILAGALGGKLAKGLKDVKEGLTLAGDGAEWLLGKMGILTAATEAQTAASEAEAAAATEADVAMDANPIGLLILAIIALVAIVVLLATHWRQVWHVLSEAGLEAWHVLDGDVIHPIQHAIGALVDWIARNWKVVAAWLTDPIGMAAFEIRTHTHQIAQEFDRLRHDVAAILAGARHDIEVFALWVPRAIEAAFIASWHLAVRGAELLWRGVLWYLNTLLGFYEKLPGRVLSFLEKLPGQMLTLGRNVIMGLIHGIENAASAIPSLMSGLAHTVESYFTNPLQMFSPSRKFFGHGVNTVKGYILGALSQASALQAAMRGLGSGVAAGGLGTGGTGGAYGGMAPSVHVQVPVTMQGTAQLYNTPAFLQYLQSVVQEAILRYQLNNPSTGLALPGRGF